MGCIASTGGALARLLMDAIPFISVTGSVTHVLDGR